MEFTATASRRLILATAIAALFGTLATPALADTETLLEKLHEKGVLSDDEYEQMRTEARAERRSQALKNATDVEKEQKSKEAVASASKLKLPDAIKSMELYGDIRLRYEDRIASSNARVTNATGGVLSSGDYDRQRWRYALRLGVRGDVADDFFYGIRLETSTNARSSWVTFADDTANAPSAKNSDTIGVGQVFVGWRATDWLTLQGGKMPNPLYTSPMVWDPDIAPEGFAERFNFKLNDSFSAFATLGQFQYLDVSTPSTNNSDVTIGKQNLMIFAWEVGGAYKFAEDKSLKAGVNYYTYSGGHAGSALTGNFTGQPTATATGNFNNTGNASQVGTDNLEVVEIPFEFKFPMLNHAAMLYGNVAKNLKGKDRATAAGLSAFDDQDKAFQAGFSFGSANLPYGTGQGPVYGSSAKKGTWETRFYFQRVEAFALDPNLMDSDFFEGRTNMQGWFVAGAYSPADAVITTVRYGQAQRYNDSLGTGGANQDIPQVNPITDYKLLQFDLTLRF
jgi:Putative porin